MSKGKLVPNTGGGEGMIQLSGSEGHYLSNTSQKLVHAGIHGKALRSPVSGQQTLIVKVGFGSGLKNPLTGPVG